MELRCLSDYRAEVVKEALALVGSPPPKKQSLESLLHTLEKSFRKSFPVPVSSTEMDIIKIKRRLVVCLKKDKGEKPARLLLSKLENKIEYSKWD
jgi:hypothetical protein